MKVQSLKSSTAQKLRGNGLIHYRLIVHNKKLYLVLQKNDDGGHFSNEIVSYERIFECVEGLEEPVVSRVFRSAFDSKSTNNAGFLLADIPHPYLEILAFYKLLILKKFCCFYYFYVKSSLQNSFEKNAKSEANWSNLKNLVCNCF